jgi:Na+-transporting methylmalonyl-CoA/oxaloacetate decarboxylase gamma subunit
MTIVFAVLILLAVVIQVIKAVAYKEPGSPAAKKTGDPPANNPAAKAAEGAVAVKPAGAGDIPVRVAAACAAVAAYLDGAPHRIVSIRRLTPRSLWVQAARMENITSGVIPRHRR